MIKLIVAYDKYKTIGNKGNLPWKIKNELQHFKNTTLNDTLIMGRKTFESLPGKLPNRKHIVLSSGDVKNADKVIHNEKELLTFFSKFKNSNKILWITGGKSLYEKYYQYAHELIISEINGKYEGDVKLNMDLSNWQKTIIFEDNDFKVYKYIKK